MHRVFVTPAKGADGSPKIVPKTPAAVLGRRRGDDWPSKAIAPGGESVPESRFISDLIRSGDLVEGEQPEDCAGDVPSSADSRGASAEPGSSKRTKSKALKAGEE